MACTTSLRAAAALATQRSFDEVLARHHRANSSMNSKKKFGDPFHLSRGGGESLTRSATAASIPLAMRE
jgi:hypothetical protein